jgi:hypothetical protein
MSVDSRTAGYYKAGAQTIAAAAGRSLKKYYGLLSQLTSCITTKVAIFWWLVASFYLRVGVLVVDRVIIKYWYEDVS